MIEFQGVLMQQLFFMSLTYTALSLYDLPLVILLV